MDRSADGTSASVGRAGRIGRPHCGMECRHMLRAPVRR